MTPIRVQNTHSPKMSMAELERRTLRWNENRRANHCLSVGLRHIDTMAQDPHFAIMLTPPRGGSFGYGWTILERGKVRQESFRSFSTKREAQSAADAVMQRLVPARKVRK
jgi:hypothetical protein